MVIRSVALAAVGVFLVAVPAAANPVTIVMGDNYFRPHVRTVPRGTKVVWVNRGHRYHTITARRWSVELKPGERYSRRVRHGFRYVCAYHGAMTGRMVVK